MTVIGAGPVGLYAAYYAGFDRAPPGRDEQLGSPGGAEGSGKVDADGRWPR